MTDCSSHWSWISLKAEAARLESLFYVMVALNGTRIISTIFSNISIITRNISTIFSLYRSLPAIYQRFDKGYQFADKSRQYQRPSPYFYQYITISSMLKCRKHPLVS